MNSEYLKVLAKDFNDRLPDMPEEDFLRRVKDDILSIIEPVQLTPFLQDDKSFLKPWKFVEGTKESVKVSDVIKSIYLADPLDLYGVVMANRRFAKEDQLFNDPNNVEQDAYKLSIYLRNPEAYLSSVELQMQKSFSKCDL